MIVGSVERISPHEPSLTANRERERVGIISWVIAAYVLSVPLGKSARVPVNLPLVPGTASTVLGLVVIAAVGFELVVQPTRRRGVHSVVLVWLALVGLVALSYSWTGNPGKTFDGIIVLVSLVMLSTVVAVRRFDASEIDLLEMALVASGAAVGVIAIYQWSTNSLADSGTQIDRFALVGGDPNHTVASLLLPFAASLVVALDRDAALGRRRFALASLILVSVAVALTASRGGLLAILALVVVVIGYVRSWALSAVLLLGAIACYPFVSLPAGERQTGLTGRPEVWRIGVLNCDENCWFGSGWATFPDVYERTAVLRPELAARGLRYDSHNLLLGALVEVGMFAVVVVIMLFVLGMFAARRSSFRLGQPVAAALVGQLVANMFVDGLDFKYIWLVLMMAVIVDQVDSSVEVMGVP